MVVVAEVGEAGSGVGRVEGRRRQGRDPAGLVVVVEVVVVGEVGLVVEVVGLVVGEAALALTCPGPRQ